MNFKLFLVFFILTSIVFILFRTFLQQLDYHIASLASQVISILVIWILEDFVMFNPTENDKSQWDDFIITIYNIVINPKEALKNLNYNDGWKEVWFIVLGNALIGWIGLLLLTQRIDFTELELRNLDISKFFIFSGTINILLVQVGGWPLQAFLTFLFITILDGQGDLRYYLRLVGIAYVGYLLLSVVVLIVNPFILSSPIKVTGVSESISNFHIVSGKLAEFYVMTLIAYGVMVEEKFRNAKSLVCAVGPSFLLLSSRIMVNSLFNFPQVAYL